MGVLQDLQNLENLYLSRMEGDHYLENVDDIHFLKGSTMEICSDFGLDYWDQIGSFDLDGYLESSSLHSNSSSGQMKPPSSQSTQDNSSDPLINGLGLPLPEEFGVNQTLADINDVIVKDVQLSNTLIEDIPRNEDISRNEVVENGKATEKFFITCIMQVNGYDCRSCGKIFQNKKMLTKHKKAGIDCVNEGTKNIKFDDKLHD